MFNLNILSSQVVESGGAELADGGATILSVCAKYHDCLPNPHSYGTDSCFTTAVGPQLCSECHDCHLDFTGDETKEQI